MTKIMTPTPLAAKKTPSLRFSPTAWAKLLYLRDYGNTEVGGFAVTSAEDLLLVEDVQLVKQECSWAHVAFDDGSVADFFDQEVDAGRRPEQFARIWVHTHPGECPRPSAVDEETFARVFGGSDWGLMFILARHGQTYSRLRFNAGPGGSMEIPVGIDFGLPFASCDVENWELEYLANIQLEASIDIVRPHSESAFSSPFDEEPDRDWLHAWRDYVDDPQKDELES